MAAKKKPKKKLTRAAVQSGVDNMTPEEFLKKYGKVSKKPIRKKGK